MNPLNVSFLKALLRPMVEKHVGKPRAGMEEHFLIKVTCPKPDEYAIEVFETVAEVDQLPRRVFHAAL